MTLDDPFALVADQRKLTVWVYAQNPGGGGGGP
jgi:hypothetical protein